MATVGGVRWTAALPPATRQGELHFQVQPHVTGWNRALRRDAVLEVNSAVLSGEPPRAVRIPYRKHRVSPCGASRSPITNARLQDFSASSPVGSSGGQKGASRPASVGQLTSKTRIRPPKDIIKLEDRLQYLLQPSLEMILSERSLEFPFVPFPYQMEGIAFLYAREAAVLADEMGLGKDHAGRLRQFAFCSAAARYNRSSWFAPSRLYPTGSASSLSGRRRYRWRLWKGTRSAVGGNGSLQTFP